MNDIFYISTMQKYQYKAFNEFQLKKWRKCFENSIDLFINKIEKDFLITIFAAISIIRSDRLSTMIKLCCYLRYE